MAVDRGVDERGRREDVARGRGALAAEDLGREEIRIGRLGTAAETRAKKLCNMVQKFQPVFTAGVPLDVEWVLEGEDVWIVQARPFVGS